MSQVQQAISGISINSTHYINQLESSIIQIARCLAMEKKVPVDPDSKELTRQVVQEKLNTLLSEDQVKEIKKTVKDLRGVVKNTKADPVLKALCVNSLYIIELMGLDNV